MRAALINSTSNVVENIIMANPEVDPAPPGTILIGLPDGSPVSIDWLYDPATGEFSENT